MCLLDPMSLKTAHACNHAMCMQGKPGKEQSDSHFPEEVCMCWFVQLLMALNHLHSRHIIHRE